MSILTKYTLTPFVILSSNFSLECIASGFDCAKASGAAEATIRAEPGRSRLDDRMAATYSAVRAPLKIRDRSASWVTAHSQCQTAACVSDAFQQRLAVLRHATPQPEGATLRLVRDMADSARCPEVV